MSIDASPIQQRQRRSPQFSFPELPRALNPAAIMEDSMDDIAEQLENLAVPLGNLPGPLAEQVADLSEVLGLGARVIG